MRKNFKITIITCLLSLIAAPFLTSCSDFFEPEQEHAVNKDDRYKSLFDIQTGVLGAYSKLRNVAEQTIILGDLRADLLQVSENYDADLSELDKVTVTKGNRFVDSRGFYDIIRNCNDMIANMDGVMKKDAAFTEVVRDAHKAEMITLRSWAYLQLIRMYKEVPVTNHELDQVYEGEEIYEMYDRSRMLNWLAERMNWAIQQESLNYSNFEGTLWRKQFVNRKNLLGEIALELGAYGDAVNLFIDTIVNFGGGQNNSDLKCEGFTGDDWEETWSTSTSNYSEKLSYIPFRKSNKQQNDLEMYFSSKGKGKYLLRPTDRVIELWKAQVRKDGSLGDLKRGLGGSFTSSEFDADKKVYIDPEVSKYQFDKKPFESDAQVTIYTASDVHLMLAEALNRNGEHRRALGVVNNNADNVTGIDKSAGIRGRVGLENIDLLKFTGLDKATQLDSMLVIEDVIVRERALELAFQGRRWYDLMRVARRRNDPDFLAKRVAEQLGDEGEALRQRLRNSDNWYLPFDMYANQGN
ncbi:hypothetical protein FUAX_44010 (plasmid) [Fulvitalea axinellae]|uniref:RagB/SusD domain-containing protein n=1 Tax=Fulvitalea axinellae TaxID=1182444 RepID=A0AAU9CIL2_9BACT|nr:hypothetical protein FUAX_44010 [Fulvitalea axinellae]